MLFVYDDGGRKAAGYKGTTGDCACRAVAIAAQRPYQEVYDLINEYAKKERTGKRKRKVSNARTGVYQTTMLKVMSHYGFKWVATMHIGQGCTVHLREDELPRGRIVCNLSRHYAAVIDGEPCARCGGSGSYARSVAYTKVDDGICHKCNGSGKQLPRLTDKKIAEIAKFFTERRQNK